VRKKNSKKKMLPLDFHQREAEKKRKWRGRRKKRKKRRLGRETFQKKNDRIREKERSKEGKG
jgi:hypothetical protein